MSIRVRGITLLLLRVGHPSASSTISLSDGQPGDMLLLTVELCNRDIITIAVQGGTRDWHERAIDKLLVHLYVRV